MTLPAGRKIESSEALNSQVETYAEAAGLSNGALLKLIEKWRRLQSGSSRTKAPAYSQED